MNGLQIPQLQNTQDRAIMFARFWSKVRIVAANDCWLWLGCKDKSGYGRFRARAASEVRYAHRVAYTIAVEPIPDGVLICHRCDNPPCCNPSHLFIGTHATNSLDCVVKGRSNHGERNPNARLTINMIERILALLADGKSPVEVASLARVTPDTIYLIRAKKIWRREMQSIGMLTPYRAGG